MLMVWLSFVSFVYINYNSYDSDDLLLTQILLQRNTGINSEDKDAEDEEDDENYN